MPTLKPDPVQPDAEQPDSGQETGQAAVRLVSIFLHPQDDDRLVFSLAFSPAASALLRAMNPGSGGKTGPEPAVKQQRRSKRRKSPGKLAKAAASLLSLATGS